MRSNTKQLMVTAAFIIFFNSHYLSSDSFYSNSYNNHGVIGLINTPTARVYDEAAFGFTLYDGSPDQKITMTSSPYDWMEASFFYTNIQNIDYGSGFDQDYKDKGFNIKFRLKEEGNLPAIAVGFNDIAGTGYYSSEYLVGSYGINNVDLSFGLGWGTLNNSKHSFRNPLETIYDGFGSRPDGFSSQGGQFEPSRYFSGPVSPFFGLNYVFNRSLKAKIEFDSTDTNARIDYGEKPKSDFSLGIEYSLNQNWLIGLSFERGNYLSLKLNFKENPSETKRGYKYKPANVSERDTNLGKFVRNLQENGIGVKKIIEDKTGVGLEITQFTHPNLEIIEDIIYSARRDSGLRKDVKIDYTTANLRVKSEIDNDFLNNSEVLYSRPQYTGFNTNTRLNFRPFLAAREGFFKYAVLLENDSEYIFADNFFFSANLKYSLKDNFEDLTVPPKNTFPAQVRSDVKRYLNNFENRLIIGRAQFDYFKTLAPKHHFMATAGILEEMFAGVGFEYLYFDPDKNYAIGFEAFDVTKRDYDLRFGTLDYRNTFANANFYYRNYKLIPFDAKLSVGEYLAGDEGATVEFSRSFKSGMQLGVFATFTDVSAVDFGEGSFDKGIFFNIPIYKNFISYTWRPLTKDPGARLNRKNNLYDLVAKFTPVD
tara:strand:+ start:34752 stop:36704 length:1953 start_codon:yes stop_codon:yes gene_type:complete